MCFSLPRYILESFPHKVFLSIDIFEGYLYMTEKNSNKIQKVSSFSARPTLADVRKMKDAVWDVRVVRAIENGRCASPVALKRLQVVVVFVLEVLESFMNQLLVEKCRVGMQ